MLTALGSGVPDSVLSYTPGSENIPLSIHTTTVLPFESFSRKQVAAVLGLRFFGYTYTPLNTLMHNKTDYFCESTTDFSIVSVASVIPPERIQVGPTTADSVFCSVLITHYSLDKP